VTDFRCRSRDVDRHTRIVLVSVENGVEVLFACSGLRAAEPIDVIDAAADVDNEKSSGVAHAVMFRFGIERIARRRDIAVEWFVLIRQSLLLCRADVINPLTQQDRGDREFDWHQPLVSVVVSDKLMLVDVIDDPRPLRRSWRRWRDSVRDILLAELLWRGRSRARSVQVFRALPISSFSALNESANRVARVRCQRPSGRRNRISTKCVLAASATSRPCAKASRNVLRVGSIRSGG
jgi:hypothetical protein